MKWFYPPTIKFVGFSSWLLFASLAFLVVPAQAVTYTVTNLTDSGPGSLRQVVLDAGTTITSNSIVFQAGLTGTITLTTGEIAINSRLTITGPGMAALSISGNTASRIFNINSIVTIKNLTLKDGKSSGDGGAMYNSGNLTASALTLSGNNAKNGGGIYNYGTMTATNLTLSGNSVTSNGGAGNGIYNYGTLIATDLTLSGNNANCSTYHNSYCNGGGIYNTGTLTATNLTLSNNSILGYYSNYSSKGGGIWNNGSITITGNSTLSGNSATDVGGGIYNNGTLSVTGLMLTSNNSSNLGGGVYTDSAKTTTFDTCTLYNNAAPNGGGGVYNTGALLNINNSTLLGNKSSVGAGGGINNQSGLTLINSTINTNTARTHGGGIFNHGTLTAINNTVTENFVTLGDGGGIYNDSTANLGNSIVVGNTATTAPSLMNSGTGFTSKGANLFGENGLSGVVDLNLATNDLVLAGAIDTAIAPLDENGGPTITHALVAGSPAINTGDNTLIPNGVTTDQRGPGFARIVGTKVDIGAVEYNTGVNPVFNATTNAATTITATSAKLNGSVTSSAIATVSFDFGISPSYGTSIAATPAQVYSGTAVAVAATKTGLTCGTTHYYRVKAVNSTGTSYGLGKTFTTAACATGRRADFIITGLTLTPATPVANGTFNLAVVVKNQGKRLSDGGFLDVWANQAAVPTCGAEGTKYVDVGFIAAGISKTITVAGLPAGAKGVNKIARAYVDSWCEIVESNETNNQLTKAYTVP